MDDATNICGMTDKTFVCNPTTTRGQPLHLSGDAKTGDRIVYCNGNSVVIRKLSDPASVTLYRDHTVATTVARMSPSGFYCASGDVSGTVRVWDTVNEEHITKVEVKALSGAVMDIQWSPDNQRIVAVGDGKERFGHVFIWDTGSSIGEISGHSKRINGADFKPTRPFRIATASEDFQVNFFEGPPFKFVGSNTEHKNFANCVRFSPDGKFFVSVSNDKQIFLFDGKTGEKLGNFDGKDGHAGSIYSVAWSPDSRFILTGSADKTAKLWDATTCRHVQTFKMADKPSHLHMVAGVAWNPAEPKKGAANESLWAVTVQGDLYELNRDNGDEPLRILTGHVKPPTSLCLDTTQRLLYSADAEGNVLKWELDGSGSAERLSHIKHGAQVNGVAVSAEGQLVTIGLDNSLRHSDAVSGLLQGEAFSFETNPTMLRTSAAGVTAVAFRQMVQLHRPGVPSLEVGPSEFGYAMVTAFDLTSSSMLVGLDDCKCLLFTLPADHREAPTLAHTFTLRGPVVAVALSSNEQLLAIADAERELTVFSVGSGEVVQKGWGVFHTARLTSLAFSPSAALLASGSLDSSFIIWNLNAPQSRVQEARAHVGGINAIAWLADDAVVTTGKDSCIRWWQLRDLA